MRGRGQLQRPAAFIDLRALDAVGKCSIGNGKPETSARYIDLIGQHILIHIEDEQHRQQCNYGEYEQPDKYNAEGCNLDPAVRIRRYRVPDLIQSRNRTNDVVPSVLRGFGIPDSYLNGGASRYYAGLIIKPC